MNKLYGLEPNLRTSNPDIFAGYVKDAALPKYFYIKLEYLKEGSFQEATSAARKIIDSLIEAESNLLIFKTFRNGTV